MKIAEQFKASFDAAAPGEWIYSDDLSAIVRINSQKHRVEAICDFGKINNYEKGNAQFILLCHKHMPQLIKILEALDDFENIEFRAISDAIDEMEKVNASA